MPSFSHTRTGPRVSSGTWVWLTALALTSSFPWGKMTVSEWRELLRLYVTQQVWALQTWCGHRWPETCGSSHTS